MIDSPPPAARANPLWGEDWADVRGLWRLDPRIAHLNHGGYGAVPVVVRERQDRWRAEADANPGRFFRRILPGELEKARLTAAFSSGADQDGFAFVPNVMTGINTVLRCLDLAEGDEVLITECTFGAVRLAVERACARRGATVRIATMEPDLADEQRVEELASQVGERTVAAVVDQVSAPIALVMPTAQLVRALRALGVVTIVDGAHGPGMAPEGVAELAADFWVGAFHKWACAAHGAAGLYAAPAWRDRLSPLVITWEYDKGFPVSLAFQGTSDPTAFLTVPDAVRVLDGLGRQRLHEHNKRLAAYGAQIVADALGTGADAPTGRFLYMRPVRLPLPAGVRTPEAKAVRDRIADDLSTEVSVVAWRGRAWLRLSAQIYNAPADYERLAAHLPRMLA